VATKRERLASRGPLRGFVGTVTNELLLERGIHRRAEIAGSRTVRS
jgi:hypothetical protein